MERNKIKKGNYRDRHGKNNPNWKNSGIKICLFCNKKYRNYSKVRKFCSFKCYISFPKKESSYPLKGKTYEQLMGKKKALKRKQKLSKTIKYQIKQGIRQIPSCKGLKIHSEQWKRQLSLNFKLEKNPNWQGGQSFEPYTLDFNNTLKEQIRKRDNYRCQECFRHQSELRTKTNRQYKLYIHHIDYNKKNCKETNLISLCHQCHNQTNFDRNNWQTYFKNKIKGVC